MTVDRKSPPALRPRGDRDVPSVAQVFADVFGPHEIPRWPFIPLAAPLVLLAWLKLRRVL